MRVISKLSFQTGHATKECHYSLMIMILKLRATNYSICRLSKLMLESELQPDIKMPEDICENACYGYTLGR